MNYKYELVGVLGLPVAENPTCVMQEAAFAALELPWRYLTIEVKPESLPDAIRGVRAFGMMGVNLTIPHKVAVLPLLDEISPDAAIIGAVNTVRRAGDKLIGENTDEKGFLRGVREEAGMDPAGKNIVVLGAGGAARAITVELALAGAGQITVWNRSAERGESLCRGLQQRTSARAVCAVARDLSGWPGRGHPGERDFHRIVSRHGSGARCGFQKRPPRLVGVRRSAQPAGHAHDPICPRAGVQDADRSADAGLSRRDRV